MSLSLILAWWLAQTEPDFNVGLELFKQSPLVAGILAVVFFFIKHIDKVHERNLAVFEASKRESASAMAQIVQSNQTVIAPLIEALKTNTEVVRSNIPVLTRVEKVLDMTLQQRAAEHETQKLQK